MDELDHRSLGNRLDLFHQQEEGPGMIFWHPRGWAVYRVIEDHIRAYMRRAGFQEVRSPQILSRDLWERSGHWEKFGAHMFTVDDGERAFAVKPMSCPGHVQIFNSRQRSYRDLPLRYAEFGACHRNEPSGALLGLMRTRAFTQDDAHVFCLEHQVEDEVARFAALLRQIYLDFGFGDFKVAFSTRPAIRAGGDALWDRAEAMLSRAADRVGLDYALQPGEGAFYGPKLEFLLPDRQGKFWQCGTIQLDFVLPDRLSVEIVSDDNRRARPIMLHHAVLGSIERFFAMLLERWQGHLPLWLAPQQILIANIQAAQETYARAVAEAFEAAGLRVKLDHRSETLSRRIVQAHADAIPLIVVVGAREAADDSVALRARDGTQRILPLRVALAELQRDLAPPIPKIDRQAVAVATSELAAVDSVQDGYDNVWC
jgi:threonyl-tRNA synthetase